MLTSLLCTWRTNCHKAEMTVLARRLGPHLARDIGIELAETPRFVQFPHPF
ncbi:MAG: hypothetical protein V4747_09000 [Pseudomonadota bacterium]